MSGVRVPNVPSAYDRSHMEQLSRAVTTLDQTTLRKSQRNFINGDTNTELVLVDANGGKWKLSVDTSGNVSTTAVT